MGLRSSSTGWFAAAALLVAASCSSDSESQQTGEPTTVAPATSAASVPETSQPETSETGTGETGTGETGTGDDAAAAAPSKSDPAAYTQHLVQQAIDDYDAEGREALLEVVNSPANSDGEWYLFVIDAEGDIIGHPDSQRLGLSLYDWVGTDINGYNFGPEMMAADETGRWVPYVYINPPAASDDGIDFQLKNAWVKRHDGLLFASGWYIDADRFLPELITEAAGHFRTGGLDAILAFYSNPTGIATGLIPTVAYYNQTDSLEGDFAGFIAAPDGELLTHFDPSLIGTDIEDLLGPAVRDNATADGAWVTADDNPAGVTGPETMRIYVIDVDGTLIGGGWYRH